MPRQKSQAKRSAARHTALLRGRTATNRCILSVIKAGEYAHAIHGDVAALLPRVIGSHVSVTVIAETHSTLGAPCTHVQATPKSNMPSSDLYFFDVNVVFIDKCKCLQYARRTHEAAPSKEEC